MSHVDEGKSLDIWSRDVLWRALHFRKSLLGLYTLGGKKSVSA